MFFFKRTGLSIPVTLRLPSNRTRTTLVLAISAKENIDVEECNPTSYQDFNPRTPTNRGGGLTNTVFPTLVNYSTILECTCADHKPAVQAGECFDRA